MAGQCANPPGRRHREQLPLWAALQLSAFSSKILLNYDVTRPPPRTAHQTTRHGHVALAACAWLPTAAASKCIIDLIGAIFWMRNSRTFVRSFDLVPQVRTQKKRRRKVPRSTTGRRVRLCLHVAVRVLPPPATVRQPLVLNM
jgi:hypothetical protein